MDMDDIILEIGTNTSGIDCGEVDYAFRPYNLEKLKPEDIKRVRNMLFEHIIRCDKLLVDIEIKTSFVFKVWRLIDLRYFPIFKKNYSMFPIRVKLKKRLKWKFGDQPMITAHGWQNGWCDGKRHYGWTLHLGNLLVIFGRKSINV